MSGTSDPARPPSTWIPYVLPWDDAPLDISFRFREDKPAGKHGFVTVQGDRFVFEDGAEARFWGTCLNSAANFPSHEQAEKLARRLARFGINMVRTHQMDAEWSTPNLFQFTRGEAKADTLRLDPESLDRLDYLIYCLQAEGIYIYLDLLTYRRFKRGDGVAAAEQLGNAAKPYANYDPRLIELQKQFNRDLWTHVNPYTGLAARNNPAIALTAITNENDTLATSLPITVEPYRSRLEERYRAWAAEQGVTVPPCPVDFAQRDEPMVRFLHDVQLAYYAEMTADLRQIGVRIPVAGGNWNTGLAGLSSYRDRDFCDVHVYWDMWSDTAGHNKMMMAQKYGWAQSCAKYRLLDRPFFVSEWDQVWPNEWRGESPLLIAALGAFQGWSGMLVHTYRYRSAGPVRGMGGVVMGGTGYRVNFETFNDPAIFGLFYHAALLFRRGHVRPAQASVGVQVSEADIFRTKAVDFPALFDAAERHKAGMVLPGHRAPAGRVCAAQAEAPACPDGPILSDTGELCRDPVRRLSWIDTPGTQAVYGFLGAAGPIELGGLAVTVTTPFAVIAVSSLTDDPIACSDNLLLTAVGRADNTGARYNDEHTQRLELGREPTRIEVIEAEVRLRTDTPGLRVLSIDPEGLVTGELPAVRENGLLRFEIGKAFPSMYYLIQR